MELLKIKVGGFKNLKQNEISLEPKVTALISCNSYGKSNLLEAIEFGLGFMKCNEKNKRRLMGIPSFIPMNIVLQNEDFMFDLEGRLDKEGTAYIVQYGYSFEWQKDDGGRRIRKEYLKYKKEHDKKYTQLISRDLQAFYKPSETARCTMEETIGQSELLLKKLADSEEVFYSFILNEIMSVSAVSLTDMDVNSYYNPKILWDSDYDPDALMQRNVAHSFENLRKKHPETADMLLDAYLQLFPNIVNVGVTVTDNRSLVKQIESMEWPKDLPYTYVEKSYQLVYRDKNMNQPLGFHTLSDGARRVFKILVDVASANAEGYDLILLEEPENCIHPALLNRFLIVLDQLSGSSNVIFASHSPYLVQFLKSGSLLIGKPNENGVADFAPIKGSKIKSIEKDAERYSTSVGNYVFELLSGSDDDIEALLGYLA